MKRLRPATPEEIEKIKDNSDLDPTCIVLALDTEGGTELAVIRTAIEVDPVHFSEGSSTRLRAVFMRDIETYLSARGASSYYFNVDADNKEWQDVVKTWGAEQVSQSPELRFKRML